MTTELLKQITQISNEIKNIHGDEYGEQYSNVAINLISKNQSNINEYQILIEAAYSLIDSDYKDKLINNLHKKTKEQDIRILNLEKDIKILKEDNKQKDIRILNLEKDNIELKKDNIELKKEIKVLKDDKQKFDALVKLHECNTLVNEEFKKLYKKYFNKKRSEYIPNIGEFILDPPTEDDEADYIFWKEFNMKYPQSNNINFRIIYKQISNDRTIYGAHANIKTMDKDEFVKLINIVYPEEYNKNKQLYEEYRDWLFLFPV